MDDSLDTPDARLRWARQKAGFPTSKSFAKVAGVNPTTYRAYENGQNSFSKLAGKFAPLLHVSAQWLLEGGEAQDYVIDDRPGIRDLGTPDVLTAHEIELVRKVDITYAMGAGSIIEDYPEEGALPFNRAFLRSISRAPSERLFLATGQGDSMEPTLLREDMVLVDTSVRQITEQDRIWALSYAGVGMIKRLRVRPGKVIILSDNPTVPPDEANPDDIYIVGKVVWVGRKM